MRSSEDRLSSKKEIESRRMHAELQAAWDRINHMQGLIRTPKQWAREFARMEGRRPEGKDWSLYWTFFKDFVALKKWIKGDMIAGGLLPDASPQERHT